MIPNILFITFDSLRADRCYGINRSTKTPNIDFLIKKGIYFSQTISSSDGTGICLGNIFTALYSFKSGITLFNFDPNTNNYIDVLKKNGYNTYCTIPDLSFFFKLTSNFDDVDAYVYDERNSWIQLKGGIGKQILEKLQSKMTEPWFYYIHLMDLHTPFFLPSDYDSPQFGVIKYDRMLSSIDVWIGKFLKSIDLNKTLIVISADHGDYIPFQDEYDLDTAQKIQNLLRKGKRKIPSLEPFGVKVFILIKKFMKFYRFRKLKMQKKLSEDQLRTFNMRGESVLYDEIVRIPLIFSGYGITPQIISNQVRNVDIFPTIVEIIGVQESLSGIHGRSLLPLINGQKFQEIPSYIENTSKDPKKLGNLVGIRTLDYKYLRPRDGYNGEVYLYDLKDDSSEKNNIANTNKKTVERMEEMLKEIKKDANHEKIQNELSKEEYKKIEEELKKLGYI